MQSGINHKRNTYDDRYDSAYDSLPSLKDDLIRAAVVTGALAIYDPSMVSYESFAIIFLSSLLYSKLS